MILNYYKIYAEKIIYIIYIYGNLQKNNNHLVDILVDNHLRHLRLLLHLPLLRSFYDQYHRILEQRAYLRHEQREQQQESSKESSKSSSKEISEIARRSAEAARRAEAEAAAEEQWQGVKQQN